MQVDIYDFDKTVVPFDSALKYWGFCMVQYLFASENIIIEETEYTELVTIHAVIPADSKESVIKKITEATNGSARTEWGEDIVFAECDGQIVIF